MPRKRSTDSHAARRVLIRWAEMWSEEYGEPYMRKQSPAEQREAKRVVAAIGQEETLRRMAVYLADDSDWLAERGHPVLVFLRQVNSYRGKKGKNNGKATIARHGDFDVEQELRKQGARREHDR